MGPGANIRTATYIQLGKRHFNFINRRMKLKGFKATPTPEIVCRIMSALNRLLFFFAGSSHNWHFKICCCCNWNTRQVTSLALGCSQILFHSKYITCVIAYTVDGKDGALHDSRKYNFQKVVRPAHGLRWSWYPDGCNTKKQHDRWQSWRTRA